ncbi:putative F-box protein At5g52610 [Telopea speciosissima]|uniref:putative F-box protein At5g52610 n=1 Tax=Telopea speciosissima TaxID=54955 RepID=UPI001CC365BC|nr:putative F-box protein At5g52610 [Telopea speciosissima]
MTKIKRKRKIKISASLDFKNFDEYIIFNILNKFEADTLYSLRVVCKQWYNMIFDPYFANSNLSYGEPSILIQTPVSGSYRLGFMEMKGGEVIVKDLNICLKKPVHASYNSLVLVQYFPKPGDLSVGNPLTRKRITIPPRICNLRLDNVFGFTYIPQTREYKIVCQMFDKIICSCVFMILTLGSNEWRQVKGPQLPWIEKESISINSFAHSVVTEDDQDFLFSIDTTEETSHKTALPYSMPIIASLYTVGIGFSRRLYIMDLGGFLLVVLRFAGYAEVWVLEDFYKNQWVRRRRIFLEGNALYFRGLVGSFGNGKVILFAGFDFCYVADDIKLLKLEILPVVKADINNCIQHLNSLISCKSL